jgi:hypothetical protein
MCWQEHVREIKCADVPLLSSACRRNPRTSRSTVNSHSNTATTLEHPDTTMDLHEVQNATVRFLNDANTYLERIPGSSIAVRYIKSSYQDDPVRSAVELFLFLFAVRYLLAPKYSTQKKVHLTDAVCCAGQLTKREAWLTGNRRSTNS